MNEGTKKRILLADNSTEYRHSLRDFLEMKGFSVGEVSTLNSALEILQTDQFDLVIIDIRMRDDNDPGDMSGLEIAKFASERNIPAIIVTAFPTVEMARLALRSRGAEPFARDLISKSSSPQTLLNSIKGVLEHRHRSSQSTEVLTPFIDQETQTVWFSGKIINLTRNQYVLLERLYKKAGGVVSSQELIEAIYGEELEEKVASNDRRLRNLIERTKNIIGDINTSHQYLEVIPGRGYRLNLGFAGDPTTDAPPPPPKKDK
jgi:DNA-binding response OmpR family regulator